MLKINFIDMGIRIGEQTHGKNIAYGQAVDKVPQIMEILWPGGIPVEHYQDAELITRVLEKFIRLAAGNRKAFSESPWVDAAGYCLIGAMREEE